MKKLLLFIPIYTMIFSLNAQVMWQFNKDAVITWQYEWGDEFNGNKINEEKWNYTLGWTRSIFGNREQQYYTDGKNHVLENGVLKLVAKKEEIDARMIDGQEDNDTIKVDNKFYCLNKTHFNYTSGMINSTRKFLYGYYEIRFKAPKDKGMWPAFWLAGGFPNEEIDVFELKGERPGKAHIDIHCPNDCDMIKLWYGKKTKWGGWLQLSENLKDGFNVMAVEWQPGYIKFFMNGKSVAIARVNFAVEKTIMANLALPSDNGPFHPGPDKSFTLSNDFEIDYIRVWYLPHLKAQQRNPGQDVLRTSFSDLTSGKAALKKKSKLMYGKNVDHANEGPVISLVPINEKNYMLYVSGLPESKQVKAELKDGSGKTVFSSNLSAFQNKLDFSSTQPGEYKLVITFEGKTAEQPVKL